MEDQPKGDCATAVRALVDREPPLVGDMPTVSGWLQRVCRAAARDLPAAGVGVSLLLGGRDPMSVAASDEAGVLVEELQFTLGEGPCLAAYASRTPVLVPDLMGDVTWPGYGPAAVAHGVRAVFAFPLQAGQVRLGALDVYRHRTGALSPVAQAQAQVFAEVALEGILDAGRGPQETQALFEDGPGTRFEVYQAQGMVMVQLAVRAEEALIRMRAYAFASNRRLIEVANDIIERRVQMERD